MKIDSNSLVGIYYDENNNIITFAKEELKKYLIIIFGDNINFNNNDANVRINLIIDSSLQLKYDGFTVHIDNEDISIKSKKNQGILYGVYSLLEKLGCKFIFSDPNYQIVPQYNEFCLDNTEWNEEPYIEHRGLCLYGTHMKTKARTLETIDWMSKNRYNLLLTAINRPDDSVGGNHAIVWSELEEDLLEEVKKRGIILHISEHSTDYFFPRDTLFKLYPQWFSEINGERIPYQICYSNKEAVEYYCFRYVEFLLENPQVDMIGIWPLDGNGYCQCESCKDKDVVIKAINYIAKEIQKVRPDISVEHLAYRESTMTPPTWEVNDNLSVLVCNDKGNTAYSWALKTKAKGGAYYFDYNTGDNYRYRGNLWISPEYCKDMVNTFIAYEFKGIISLFLPISNWWQGSINYWILNKIYWNPKLDLNEELSNLVEIIFGKDNHEPILEIINIVLDNIQDKSLWSRMPHKNETFVEFINNRNKEFDKLNLNEFLKQIDRIKKLYLKVDVSKFKGKEGLHFEYLKAYIHLQELYFKLIDKYDADEDKEEKVYPYFEYLEELNSKFGQIFIDSDYAKWRIIGRDNILKGINTIYQPN